MENMEQIIKDCMIQYSGAVLQSRALVDVRDCLKPSARQIFYCMYTDKFTSDKPFKKTLKAIGSAARMFIHGDSSCEGIIMRAAQPFAMRYPLIEVEGSEGNLTESGNWSAPRYTASRLSQLSEYLFKDIKKNTIAEWRDNYDDTEQYPAVLPTKGFYNIVNGTFGIGIGLASSIPQFNLTELNNVLIKLLQNPDIPEDELIILPDFATGAILLNGNEVKEALKKGTGASCKLKSVINWNESEHALIVTEIPYGVYTNTICNELEQILLDEQNNPGIERFNDLTGTSPLIKIYLNKKANYKEVLNYLYKNTSLQYYFGINLTMLDKGRFPKVFTWKEALQAHIEHEKEVYKRGFEFDLEKIEYRLHIIDGLLICIASLDEVVSIIKNSSSPNAANIALQHNFLLDEEQAKAVLAIKLASLAKLEVEKLEQEKINLTQEANRLKIILQNEKEFNQQLINGWNEVSKKFGDTRRTIIYDNYIDESSSKQIKKVDIYINRHDKYIVKDQGRQKIKVYKKDRIVFTMSGTTEEYFYLFTNIGKCYKVSFENMTEETEGDIAKKLKYDENEHTIGSYNPFSQDKIVFFITKFGLIKKMEVNEFLSIKKTTNVITLNEKDEVIKVLFGEGNEEIIMASKQGLAIHFEGSNIINYKRNSKGVTGMKLEPLIGEIADAAFINSNMDYIITDTSSTMIKRTPISEFPLQSRATKGRIAHKLNDNEDLLEIYGINSKEEKIYHSENFGDIELKDIPELGRDKRGSKIF